MHLLLDSLSGKAAALLTILTNWKICSGVFPLDNLVYSYIEVDRALHKYIITIYGDNKLF